MNKVKKVRPILQMEATECGAASLAMILDYYGKTVTLEQLRRECGVSRNGVNAKNIVKAAQFHDLKPRAVRVNIKGVKELKTPAIIHWNMDHFLVLCGFDKKGRAVIADPVYGLRTVTAEEFSKSFTGIAIELTPTESFKRDKGSRKKNSYIALCIRSFLPSTVYFVMLELCAIIGSGAVLFLNSVFIDRILIGGNVQSLRIILRVLLYAGLISVSSMIFTENIRHRIGKKLNMRINAGFINHLLKLPIEFFAQRSEGDLSNRQNSNMLMGGQLVRMLSPVVGYVLQILVYFTLVAVFDVHIALIGVICAAVNIVATLISARKYEEKMSFYSRDMGALQSDISQAVDMIETIKSCGAENGAFARLMASGNQAINTKTDIDRTGVYTEGLFSFLNMLGSGAVLIVGVWKILSGSMTTGILIAMQSLVASMLEPMGATVNAGIKIQAIKGDAVRTNDVMYYHRDNKFLDDSSVQKGGIDGNVRLENVSFGYNPIDEPLIKDFNLTIKKGGSVAITGASGSGKSTIAKIIGGLYEENGGVVTFNGSKRSELNHYFFYSKVAVVSQNIRLFEGSVFDNITMWDDSIPYDDVVAAAKAACIHDDIISRKGGYREHVTESGKNFSGGQRQRIEIARAIVKKPSMIIMDEATSALDSDTEERIMNNIKALGITRIVIAHRLSTIMDSDEIIVMEQGTIAERGTHEELMSKNGAYCTLVRSVS